MIINCTKPSLFLFRCTKIRKSKSAWSQVVMEDVYVLNALSRALRLLLPSMQQNTIQEQAD